MHTLVLVGTVSATGQLDTVAIATFVSLFIPLLVSIITKQSASAAIKAVINIATVALTAVVALGVSPGLGQVNLTLVVNTLVLSLVASVTAYKGVWKPTGVTAAIEAKTADVGIGSASPTPAGGDLSGLDEFRPPVLEPLTTDEAGQIEAAEIPLYDGTSDPYFTDPNYDPANDLVDPETRGEDDSAGTPGAVGDSFTPTDATTPTEVKSV